MFSSFLKYSMKKKTNKHHHHHSPPKKKKPKKPHQTPKTMGEEKKNNCLYLPKLSTWIEVWVGNVYTHLHKMA